MVGSFFEQTVADVYEAYERELHRANAMDFDDLLFRAVNLLELFQEVRDRYTNAFRWILVDEYQDTNRAQYRWLQLLSSASTATSRWSATTTRAIYGFRGADITNILDFEDDYVDAHVVQLEQNYRSTQTILSAANAVVANNRGRKSKSLWTEIGEGDPIKVRELADEHAEARFVAAEIERLVDEGVSRSELAVFYRTNAQSRVLEDMLVRAQIGYQVIGGTKFYERAEIKDAVAYLTFLVNPADGGAFTRIANSPKRGIGQTSLSRVLAHADTMGITPWEAAAAPGDVPSLGTAAQQGARALHVDDGAAGRARRGRRAGRGAARGDAARDRLPRGARGRADDRGAGADREPRGVRARRARVRRRPPPSGEEAGVAEFLQQIALLADADQIRDDEGLVTLMTLHNAKGLEFPIVFIIGCEDGVFPHSRAIDEGSLEEERRLAYVGITRAMRDLYITYARRRNVFGAAVVRGALALHRRDPARADRPARPQRGRRRPPGGRRPRGVVGDGRGGRGRRPGRRRRRAATAPARSSGWATTSSTRRSARASCWASSRAASSSCASPSDGSQRKLMADYAPIRKR